MGHVTMAVILSKCLQNFKTFFCEEAKLELVRFGNIDF